MCNERFARLQVNSRLQNWEGKAFNIAKVKAYKISCIQLHFYWGRKFTGVDDSAHAPYHLALSLGRLLQIISKSWEFLCSGELFQLLQNIHKAAEFVFDTLN